MSVSSTRLGNVVEVVMGQAPPGEACNKDGDGTVFVKAGEFQERYPIVREWTTTPLKLSRPDDVLVCVVGATAGKVNQSSFDCAIGRSVAAVRAISGKLNSDFLFHFLKTKVIQLRNGAQGAAQGVITREMIHSLPLMLPPLSEQRRIAAILDQADALRVKRRETLAQLDSLTQAIFFEMFGNGDFPASPLEDMCELITDGTHQTPTYAETGVIFLSAKNVTSGYIDWQNIKFIPESLHFELHRRLSPKRGDILLAKNGTTGVAAIVDRDCIFDIYVSLALLRTKNDVLPEYLLGAINSPICKQQFNGALKGIGVPNLHLKEIRATKIPHPPLNQQEKFSGRIKAVERLKAAQLSSLVELNNLFSSIQHRAFRGEL